MQNVDLHERFKFIGTEHLFQYFREDPDEGLASHTTGLWLEMPKNWKGDGSPDVIPLSELIPYLESDPNSRTLMREAAQRDIPVFLGDVTFPLQIARYETGLSLFEALSGFGILVGSSRRVRRAASEIVKALHRLLTSMPKERRKPLPPMKLTRRALITALGGWLVLPALSKGAQTHATHTELARVMRSATRVLHPEHDVHVLHVRNAIQALKIEYADQHLGQTFPCAAFGFGHTGIKDELRRTAEQKLTFLRKHRKPYLTLPQTYQFEELRFRRSEDIPRWQHVATHEVPELKEFSEEQR